jgi:hypothetical protein
VVQEFSQLQRLFAQDTIPRAPFGLRQPGKSSKRELGQFGDSWGQRLSSKISDLHRKLPHALIGSGYITIKLREK